MRSNDEQPSVIKITDCNLMRQIIMKFSGDVSKLKEIEIWHA